VRGTLLRIILDQQYFPAHAVTSAPVMVTNNNRYIRSSETNL